MSVEVNGEEYTDDQFQQAAAILRSNTSVDVGTREDFFDRLGQMYDGDRDVYDVLGYPDEIEEQDYRAKFRRHDIAKRIVKLPAKDTWREPPDVQDDADSQSDSDFEEAIQALERDLQLWNVLTRADISAGLGEFGVLFLGLDDGQALDEPVEEGALDEGDISFATPFAQDHVVDWDLGRETEGEASDPSHPRYNKPVEYTLSFADADDDPENEEFHEDVHHSRVIHIAEARVESELMGTPRLEPVYNRLLDYEKVLGASAEMFWSGADKKWQFNIDTEPGERVDTSALEDLDTEVQRLVHDMQKSIKTFNTDINEFGGDDVDPSGVMDEIYKAISGTTGIPKRILTGSERGELASSQDRATWFGRIESRQVRFAEPMLLRPFLDRLVSFGVLPEPDGGGYEVEWPNLFELTELEQAKVWKQRSTTLKSLAKNPATLFDSTEEMFDFVMEGDKPDFEARDRDFDVDQMPGEGQPGQANEGDEYPFGNRNRLKGPTGKYIDDGVPDPDPYDYMGPKGFGLLKQALDEALARDASFDELESQLDEKMDQPVSLDRSKDKADAVQEVLQDLAPDDTRVDDVDGTEDAFTEELSRATEVQEKLSEGDRVMVRRPGQNDTVKQLDTVVDASTVHFSDGTTVDTRRAKLFAREGDVQTPGDGDDGVDVGDGDAGDGVTDTGSSGGPFDQQVTSTSEFEQVADAGMDVLVVTPGDEDGTVKTVSGTTPTGLQFEDGSMARPNTPGTGVYLREDDVDLAAREIEEPDANDSFLNRSLANDVQRAVERVQSGDSDTDDLAGVSYRQIPDSIRAGVNTYLKDALDRKLKDDADVDRMQDEMATIRDEVQRASMGGGRLSVSKDVSGSAQSTWDHELGHHWLQSWGLESPRVGTQRAHDNGSNNQLPADGPVDPVDYEDYILDDQRNLPRPDRVDALAEATNKVWQEANEEWKARGGDPRDVSTMNRKLARNGYAMNNAHETFTMFHETMQHPNEVSGDPFAIMDNHPEWVRAYLRNFNVPEETKQILEQSDMRLREDIGLA